MSAISIRKRLDPSRSASLQVLAPWSSSSESPPPSVAHLGGGVKEQTASLYAEKLAQQGFTTIGVVGICAGGGYAVAAAKADYRLRAVAIISMVNIGGSMRLGWYGDEPASKHVETFKQAAQHKNAEDNGADYRLNRTIKHLMISRKRETINPLQEQVDGIGNFYLQVLAPAPSQLPLSTLYFLDSHGQIPSLIYNPDYDAIKQSQIDWFVNASQAQQSAREKIDNDNRFYLSLAFLYIPLPEFGYRRLSIRNGYRREPTESPSFNSHFYNTLVKRGISVLGCGHDHVNDFCALLPQQTQQDSDKTP